MHTASVDGAAGGGDVLENAAALAGVLAELGVAQVSIGGVPARSRDGADLPGLIVQAVEQRGEAVVSCSRGEIVVGRIGVVWRGCDEALGAALQALGGVW